MRVIFKGKIGLERIIQTHKKPCIHTHMCRRANTHRRANTWERERQKDLGRKCVGGIRAWFRKSEGAHGRGKIITRKNLQKPAEGRQTDRQTDRRTDGETDKQTGGETDSRLERSQQGEGERKCSEYKI